MIKFRAGEFEDYRGIAIEIGSAKKRGVINFRIAMLIYKWTLEWMFAFRNSKS